MNRPHLIGMLFAAAAAVVGTVGLLNTEPLSPSARLGALAAIDTDADGRISTVEWLGAGRSKSSFLAMDKDASSFLEANEARPGRGGRNKK